MILKGLCLNEEVTADPTILPGNSLPVAPTAAPSVLQRAIQEVGELLARLPKPLEDPNDPLLSLKTIREDQYTHFLDEHQSPDLSYMMEKIYPTLNESQKEALLIAIFKTPKLHSDIDMLISSRDSEIKSKTIEIYKKHPGFFKETFYFVYIHWSEELFEELRGQIPIEELLEAKDIYGNPPLNRTITGKNCAGLPACLKLLAALSSSVDIIKIVQAKDNAGNTPLEALITKGNDEILIGRSALQYESLIGLLNILEDLPSPDIIAILNTKDSAGNTPLHCAILVTGYLALFGHDEIVLNSMFVKESSEVLKDLFDILNDLSLQETIEILKIKDGNGETPPQAAKYKAEARFHFYSLLNQMTKADVLEIVGDDPDTTDDPFFGSFVDDKE